ncbi:MAG: histidine--tRNA ligase [Candidatus Odyssella sp.]|nr:histidine--tRNA ligase [Candidatus Odyssella sp.]
MTSLQPIRGTHDILPDEYPRFAHVVEAARAVTRLYGYREMATPVFETTEVFARTSGETSDVVMKQMYSFVDRGGDPLTLRPEYTAGICRAFITNGQQQNVPFKVFAWGPMFRYERPQKGRYRQFYQLDIEVIGSPEPGADVEVIAVGADILDRLGVLKDCVLELNSLGDSESRAAHRKVLIDYFKAHEARLSEDSKSRLERNPLRIFDSKDEGDRALLPNAPLLKEYLTSSAQGFFAGVLRGLDDMGIAYRVNPHLVRGLDYYTHTAFEFVTTNLGAQGTVLAGGRYDGLIEQLGGPPTPGIGWAAGIERLMMLAGAPESAPRPVALVPLGEAAERKALSLARDLRRRGIAVELDYKGNMKRRLQRANKAGARAAVILGDNELAKGVAAVKDLDKGEQKEVALAALAEALSG